MQNIEICHLQYKSNLIQHYETLSDLPGFVLLESSDTKIGRYDILSACPYNYFQLDAIDKTENIFAALRALIPQHTIPNFLPFQGGALGYFSYDLAASLVNCQNHTYPGLESIPFAKFGFYDWAIITDHTKRQVYLLSKNTNLIKEIITRWNNPKKIEKFSLRLPLTPIIYQEHYFENFKKIQEYLKLGRVYQVNYTQPFIGELVGTSWNLYKKIRAINPVPFGAFMRFPEMDILSFSPERFLLYDNAKLVAAPIKGTASRSNNKKVDRALREKLLASSKNRAENVMIVDLLRNDLGRVAKPGSVTVPKLCQLQSYHSVHHLVSEIQAECRDGLDALEVFASCFPGGSITGAPKLEAMRVISELEQYARGVYCGNICYLSAHGRFDSNIAIRTMVVKNEAVYLGVGGGIVMDSTCEEEYQECYTKIQPFINTL